MALNYPDVNGNRYDHSSVEITLLGQRFDGVKSVSYKQMLEPGEVRGNRAQLIGRTRGKYSAEGNIELYRLEYDAVCALIRAQGKGLLETSFDIVVNYTENGTDVSTDKLIGCRFKSDDTSSQEGGDAITVKLDLHVMKLIKNGTSPINPARFL